MVRLDLKVIRVKLVLKDQRETLVLLVLPALLVLILLFLVLKGLKVFQVPRVILGQLVLLVPLDLKETLVLRVFKVSKDQPVPLVLLVLQVQLAQPVLG
jgi:hypothetical protein